MFQCITVHNKCIVRIASFLRYLVPTRQVRGGVDKGRVHVCACAHIQQACRGSRCAVYVLHFSICSRQLRVRYVVQR